MKRMAFVMAIFLLVGSGFGQSGVRLFLVDFEEMEEFTEISDQFADQGVVFSIEGDGSLLPIIAEEGAPTVAFNGSGADNPMSSGSGGLTDPLIDDDFTIGNDIRMDFDPPVTSIRLFVVDIDGAESVTVRAFDGAVEVDSVTKTAGQAGTGNGVSTEFFLSGDNITAAVVDAPDSNGLAIDFVNFTRPCEGAACGSQVRVLQESSPGADDFEDNELGFLLVFPAVTSTSGFYAYNVPEGDSWNGFSLTPVVDRSHLLLADTLEGVSLFIVHDRAIPNDPDGGEAEMMFELTGDIDGACRALEDDPETEGVDFYTGEPGESVFTSNHSWDVCCTDGVAITRLEGPWSMIVQFTDVDDNPGNPTIAGLTEWFAYSADGTLIELALEADRRVRLDYIPTCVGDTDDNGEINVSDLITVITDWGCVDPEDPCAGLCDGDVNEDGVVNVLDLIDLLTSWGPCD